MKNLKNQKGITLVALVVTIIVLLILAGVSLSLVAGSDGILRRASNSVDANLIASIKERTELYIAEKVTNYYQAKYVDRSISNDWTALYYLTQTNSTSFKQGDAEYTIKYDTNITTASTTSKIIVEYKSGSTTLTEAKQNAIEGDITADGSITWTTPTIKDKAPSGSTSTT